MFQSADVRPAPVQEWRHEWLDPLLPYAPVVSAIALLVGLVVAVPAIDLGLGRLFYMSDGQFAGEGSVLMLVLRNIFILLYVAVCVVGIAGMIVTRNLKQTLLGFGFAKWLFLAVCLATGPGVVANLALKDQWGRARPRDVVEFGGTLKFTPVLASAKECNRNCSFVCGKSSSIFIVFFAAACMWRRRAAALVIAGMAAGGLAGAVRMSQGAHFFSDVVFSGIFMGVTVLALHWLFEAIAASARNQNDLIQHDQPSIPVAISWHEAVAE